MWSEVFKYLLFFNVVNVPQSHRAVDRRCEHYVLSIGVPQSICHSCNMASIRLVSKIYHHEEVKLHTWCEPYRSSIDHPL